MRFLGFKIQGGASSEANVFATLLGNRGEAFDAKVVYHHWGDGDGFGRFRSLANADVQTIDVGLRPASEAASRWAKLLRVVKYRLSFPEVLAIAKKYRPDVVYSSQQLWDSALAGSVARSLGVPQIVHLHFNIGPWLSTGFSQTPRALKATRTVLGLADPLATIRSCAHVVTVSDFLRDQVMEFGVSPERVSTVHNAMRIQSIEPGARQKIRRELNIPEDAIMIANAGNLLESKGQLETVQAFAQLRQKFKQIRLIIAGDGPARAQLEALIVEHRLQQMVQLVGHRNDIPDFLSASDIFVHPSRRDPFPLAVLEGLAAGLPVVAWADGGVTEQVVHERTGLLVPTGNVEALGSALATLITNPELRQRMGEQARERVATQLSPAQAVGQFVDVLQRVTERARADEAGGRSRSSRRNRRSPAVP